MQVMDGGRGGRLERKGASKAMVAHGGLWRVRCTTLCPTKARGLVCHTAGAVLGRGWGGEYHLSDICQPRVIL